MDFILKIVDFVLHIDEYLSQIITQYGAWTYGLLFFVVFMETGFVVTPFLPGDSLIFAAAAFAARGVLNPWAIFFLLAIAAIAGDTANYWIGHAIGAKAYTGEVKWIKKEYMERTHAFFEKHGGKAIFLARFVPIVRTFAPFVAGVSEMSYGFFVRWNVIGGITWVAVFTLLGYFFGNIPFVQKNFELVIVAILVISVIPIVVEAVKARKDIKTQEHIHSHKKPNQKAFNNDNRPNSKSHEPKSNFQQQSLYEILGIKPDATIDEISAAYRKLAQENHPDKVANMASEFRILAEERMKVINAAYSELLRIHKK